MGGWGWGGWGGWGGYGRDPFFDDWSVRQIDRYEAQAEIVTGKIALAHMKEFPDYYERLARMEAEAERDWAAKRT